MMFIFRTKHSWRPFRTIPFFIALLAGSLLFSCLPEPEPDPYDNQAILRESLPTIQRNLVFWSTNAVNRHPAIWMQQLAGVRGVEEDYDRYNPTPTSTEPIWYEYYNYLQSIIENMVFYADEIDARGHMGVGRVLNAMTLLKMTDTFGDMPLSEAYIYQTAFGRPVFDDQEDVLEYAMAQLNLAIEDFVAADQGGGFKPDTSDDLIFRGDLDKWMRAAHMMKLRIMLRYAHKEQDYSPLLNEINHTDLMRSSHDNMVFSVPESRVQTNPYYQYDDAVRNVRLGKFFVDMLKETDDPRLPRLVRRNTQNEYVGSAPGQSLHEASYIGLAKAGTLSPIHFITFTELAFIRAEIYWRHQQFELADQAYTEGVITSLDMLGVRDNQWEEDHAHKEGVSLQDIMEAKYLALFLNNEVWTDHRRTGFPELLPYEEVSDIIPRRQLYPNEEVTSNPYTPANVSIFDRVWWDMETP